MAYNNEITPDIVRRDSFGVDALQPSGGMQDAAMAAAMQAQILARCSMAVRYPRDWTQVRALVLRECERPEFATVAMYALPRAGKTIEGLSIRFAEMALRAMKNLHAESNIIYDDASKRMIQVDVSDLESNVIYSSQVVVEKTVERSAAKGNVISQRQNSQGKTVYVVRATDEEVQQKCAVQISKALRTHVLRILPGDIQDDAKAKIQNTLSCPPEDTNRWAQTVKDLVDAYAGNFRIMPLDLKQHLGHSLDQLTPKELVDLRILYGSLRTGEITWAEIAAESAQEATSTEDAPPVAKTSRVKQILDAKRANKKPSSAPQAANDSPEEEDYQKRADRIVAKGQVET